jgi:AcrR family transcriptional regulator
MDTFVRPQPAQPKNSRRPRASKLRAAKPPTVPTKPPAGTKSKQATRDRILSAAVHEFADKGFAGGRLDTICAAARANIRMVYHYFTDKAGLYVAVLEHVLGELRQEELKLDVDHVAPMDGLLQLFDFTYDHFAAHPRLISLLSGENLLKAQFLKRSPRTPVISSPVLSLFQRLLRRGEADGTFRSGVDPLQLYVVVVALSYFHLSNGYTLSVIFERDVFEKGWLAEHKRIAREMVARLGSARAPGP